jgi:hypothetical protein
MEFIQPWWRDQPFPGFALSNNSNSLYGLVILPQRTPEALGISLILGIAGIGALIIHSYFIRKGRPEYKTATSLIILGATAITSLTQIVFTAKEFGWLNF